LSAYTLSNTKSVIHVITNSIGAKHPISTLPLAEQFNPL
jgi:hypothetical protein